MKNHLLLFLFPMLILITGCAAEPPAQETEFSAARELVTRGKYTEAIPELEAFIEQNPDHKNSSRAGLFLFKCHFAQNDLASAKKWCDWTIKQYPSTQEAHKCRYKLAMILLVEGKEKAALDAFTKLSESPDGPLAPESAGMAKYLAAKIKTKEM